MAGRLKANSIAYHRQLSQELCLRARRRSRLVRLRIGQVVASQDGLERGRRGRAAQDVKLVHQAATGTSPTRSGDFHRSKRVLYERRRQAAAIAQAGVEVMERTQPSGVVGFVGRAALID